MYIQRDHKGIPFATVQTKKYHTSNSDLDMEVCFCKNQGFWATERKNHAKQPAGLLSLKL